MSARVHFIMPEELVARIDAVASQLDISRGEFARRAIGAALEIEHGRAGDTEHYAYSDSERVTIANAVVRPASTVPDTPMCRTCVKYGPPGARPCTKCGHRR